jgi:hypothetical protein
MPWHGRGGTGYAAERGGQSGDASGLRRQAGKSWPVNPPLSHRRGVMSSMQQPLLDAAGHRRSPVTMPGYHRGRPPKNKGLSFAADPPTVEEIVAVMRAAGDGPDGVRLRALIVILWRAGLRISEALALAGTDLDRGRGAVLVRRGLCRIRHNPAYAECLVMPSGGVDGPRRPSSDQHR